MRRVAVTFVLVTGTLATCGLIARTRSVKRLRLSADSAGSPAGSGWKPLPHTPPTVRRMRRMS